MIPSLINIILCALVLGAHFAKYPLSDAMFAVLLGVILIFNLISLLAAIRRKKIAKEQLAVLREFLASFEITSNSDDLTDNIKLICEEVKKTHHRSNSITNKSDFLRKSIADCASNLRNINKVLNYLLPGNCEQIKELIKTHNHSSIQTLAELAKLSFPYETHYDEQPVTTYEGYSAAVYLSDSLETFIIACMLRQQGLFVRCFSAKADFSEFDLVIADDSLNLQAPNILHLSNHQSKELYLKRPFNRLSFLKAIEPILDRAKDTARLMLSKEQPSSDMLIFMQNSVLNSQMIYEANKLASSNISVSSLSEFKRLLESDFKVILLAAECAMYDYEAIKALINAAKLRRPELFVVVFHSDSKCRKSFEFADHIVKDETQAELIELIKKHL